MGIATKIDITPADLKTLQALLKRYIPQTTVWAFGSRVKFTNKPSSDLDLVAFTTKEQNTQVSLLKDAIEEAMLPYRVDLLCWHEIPENFKKNIEQQYVVVQEAQSKETVPSEWRTFKLNEVLEIKYGKDHKHLADGNIPLYGSGGIMRYVETALYEKESILIPRKGTLSNLFYLDTPFWSVDTMFYTKIKEGNNGKYLFYLLKSMDLASMNVGSAVPSLTTEVLNKVEINVPDLTTQTAIAQILTSLDDKIELNLQMNQTLEAMAQAIFKEWFVDFKFPKMSESEFTGFENKQNKEKSCKSFNSENPDSDNGLPKGWRMGKLGEVSNLIAGGDKPKEFSETDSEQFNVPIYSNGISNEGLYGYTMKPRILDESITVSARGTIGFVCLRFKPYVPIVRLISVIPNKEILTAKYLYFWFLTQNISGTGTTQQQLTVPDFGRFEVLIPSLDVVNKFTSIVDILFLKIQENKIQIQTLTQTRDALLPKLMSGKISLNQDLQD